VFSKQALCLLVIVQAARPEHQNVMSCFSEELALLEERRQQQRTDERRQQTHEQRQQRAEERRQRVLDSGIVFASPAATSAAAAGASPASISAAEAAEEAGQAELRRPGHKARPLTRKKEPTLQHAQQCDARQRRRILKKLQQNRQTERQLEERGKGRQPVPVVLKHEAVSQQQVSGGSSTSGWGRLSSAFP
jgi:hypothetical protein